MKVFPSLPLALWLAAGPGPAGARVQDEAGPIATHREAARPAGAASPEPAAKVDADPFSWLRTPQSPEAIRWREAEAEQSRRWLQADRAYPSLLEAAERADAGDLPVQVAGGRIYARGSDTAPDRRAWTSRPVIDAAAGATPWRRDAALDPTAANFEAGAPSIVCEPGAARLCLVERRRGAELTLAAFDPAAGAARGNPFDLPPSLREVALESGGGLLAAGPEGGVVVVRRLSPGQPWAAAPVVFRSAPGDDVSPRSAVGRGGDRVSWLSVRSAGAGAAVFVDAGGAFRRLAAPVGSQVVGVVGDQLVLQLREGWSGVDALPAGALLALDLKPLLTRAPELTPHPILKLSQAPDIRQVASTRSGLLLIAREGAADIPYFCDPDFRGWAVHRLPSPGPGALEIAAAGVTDDVAVLRSRDFPQGERLWRVDMRTGATEPLTAQASAFPGAALQALAATTLDKGRIAYTLVGAPRAPGAPPRPVLLIAAPRDAAETAVARTLGALWLSHAGDLAVAGARQRRYDPGDGLTEVLVGYEDLASIGRDLVARGLADKGGVRLAGDRTGASLAAVDVVKHPAQWAAVALIDPITDPAGATAEAEEAWAQPFSAARDDARRKAWRRISPYDSLRAGPRYAPVLTVRTPATAKVFGSDAARFTARLNASGGDSLFVEAADDARASATAVAFLLRLSGAPAQGPAS